MRKTVKAMAAMMKVGTRVERMPERELEPWSWLLPWDCYRVSEGDSETRLKWTNLAREQGMGGECARHVGNLRQLTAPF